MQRVEDSHSFGIQPDHLRVDNRGAVYASRVPDDQRITLRPVSSVHGVELHPAIPAVLTQFTDTTNHRALTATFKKIRISACFVYSTPIKSCLNILDSGSQLEQPG
jgi:hypothetical protein